MLELATRSCTVMSQRKYIDSSAPGDSGDRGKSRNRIHKPSHHDVREYKYGRNSSEDPAISSSKSDKHVSTNARTHPRAELKSSDHSHSHRSKHASSNHIHNHVSPKSHDSSDKSRSEIPTPSRKRSHDSVEDDVWTEHTSSSGRIYYYNKRLDKSQWERPKGLAVKKAKTDTTPDASTNSARKTASISAATSSSSSSKYPSHSHSSHHHKDYGRSSSHRSQHRGGSHTHHLHDRKERYESSHHSSSRRGSGSRSHSRSSSPVGTGKSERDKYGSHGHSHSSKSSGYERNKEKDSSAWHSKSADHTTPSRRVNITTSPCTPVITSSSGGGGSSSMTQTTRVSPSTPHTSTPYTGSHTANTTPVLSTPQGGTFVQSVDHATASVGQLQTQARQGLPYTPQQQTSNGLYNNIMQDANVGGVAIGFVGVGGGANLASPQTVAMSSIEATGLHPLQKALLLQNQVQQQNFAIVEPGLPVAPVAQALPHHMTHQQSLPGSPLLQSPISIPQHGTGTQIVYGTPAAIPGGGQALTQVQPGVYTVASTAAHGMFNPSLTVSGNFVSINSPALQTPMSSLSSQLADSSQFPDVAKLEPVPASQVNMELFDRGLAEPWNQYNNQIQQQIESCQMESLQRRTTETIFLSSKLARSWLRLETSQISITSKDKRLNGLRGLLEDISRT